MAESKSEILQGTLDLMVLKTLDAMGPLHGYGIAKRIEQVGREALRVNQGTIYLCLVRHDGLRNALLVLQIAFSMILLVGGGLFERSVMRAWSVDLGFRTEGLLTAGFSAPPPGSAAAERLRSAQRVLIQRLRAMPGVESATLASDLPAWPGTDPLGRSIGHLDQRAAGAVRGASGERCLGLRWRHFRGRCGAGRNGRVLRRRDSRAAGRALQAE